MSATVLQRADGYWYVHDASVSHMDLGPFQSRAAAEHYRDTGVDQPISPSVCKMCLAMAEPCSRHADEEQS